MKTPSTPKYLQFILLPLFVFVLNVGWGQISENFQSWTSRNSYSAVAATQSGNGGTWTLTSCIISPTGAASGTGSIGFSQLQSANGILQLPLVANGVGLFTMQARVSGANGGFQLEKYNGISWSLITGTATATSSTTAVQFQFTINDASLNLQIRIKNTGGSGSRTLYIYDITTTSYSPIISGTATASAFTTTYGTPSAAQTFAVSGTNLTANLVATAPTGYEVSADGTNYGSTATFIQTSGSASGSLRIRLAGSATVGGSYNSQNIVLSSTGATSVNITTTASGNVVNQATPTINTLPTASAIIVGQTLSQSVLTGGSANVPGSFAFTNPNTVMNSAGLISVGITFTPTDNNNYSIQTGNVGIQVNSADANNCPSSTAVSPAVPQIFCVGASTNMLTAAISNTGTAGSPTLQYQWYYNTTNTNTISGAALVSGATSSTYTPLSTSSEVGTRYYFCVGYATDNACGQSSSTQSLASNAVAVTVNATPAAPTGTAAQSFCSGANPTVANLTATGTSIQWYSSETGGSALTSGSALSSGNYYASQIVNGCESTNRLTVAIVVNTSPVAPTGTAAQTFCAGSTVANLVASGTGILWYASSSGGNALATYASLVSGTHYYASQTANGCESSLRLDVIAGVTPSPTPGTVSTISTNANTHLVISQVYGGGGNSGATYKNDFIEIFNPTASIVDLTGWAVQVASGTGTSWAVTNLSGSIAPGKYYLIQEAAGTGGTVNLPTPEITGTITISSTAFKVALTNSTIALSGAISNGTGPTIVDFVGCGSSTTGFENALAAAPSNTTSLIRVNNGCTDTDNNSADFAVVSPSPRNSSSAVNSCSSSSTIETICSGTTPISMSVNSASGSSTYQWYYQVGLISAPTDGSTSGWISLGSSDGANTATYTPSTGITESRTYAALVTPASCGESTWASGMRQIQVVVTPGIIAGDQTICQGIPNTLTSTNAAIAANSGTITYLWESSGDNFNSPGVPISSSNSVAYSPGSLSTSTYFRRKASSTVSNVTCSVYSNTITVTINPLPTVTANNGSLCGLGSLTLYASSTGATTDWYDSSTGGTALLLANNVFVTPSLTTSTTYYVEARNTTTGCVSSTRTAVTAIVNPLPLVPVLNGSPFCSNTTGTVSISSSQSNVTYDLYASGDVIGNTSVDGTGSGLSWSGLSSGIPYTVLATNDLTGCSSTSEGLTLTTVIATPYYLDADGDTYYSTAATLLCTAPSNYSATAGNDCNDLAIGVNIVAEEICGNNVDENCSGSGDDLPGFYVSRANGPWSSASTWSYLCSINSTPVNAVYAPPAGYEGIVTVSHAVTVGVDDGAVASAGSLNISNSGSLTVNGRLTVVTSLLNDGSLTINHGGSFVQSSPVLTNINQGTGTYKVNMNLTGATTGTAPTGRYWYIGSPMSNTPASLFSDNTKFNRLWRFLGTTNSWPVVIHNSPAVTTNLKMVPGMGYLFRTGYNQTFSFEGYTSDFNNNITTNLLTPTNYTSGYIPVEGYQSTGFKYVSNPYASYVDWKLVTRTGLNVSYWIRNEGNTGYESYNAYSDQSVPLNTQTTRYIAPMQAFYVYAFNQTPSLVIPNSARTHSTNVLHAPQQNNNKVIRLDLSDGKTNDQVAIYENENAKNNLDDYDTFKMKDEHYHQFYAFEGTKELALDGLKDATAKQKVDMGIQITGAGTYTINAIELGVEEDVVLEDKFTHTFQDMKRNNTYSFTSNAGTFNNRFVLHFTLNPQTESVIESVAVTEEVNEVEGVSVYTTTGQQVKVWVTNNTDFQNATVKVYDAIGNMIERKNMTSNELLLDLNTATGVYLVEVTGDSKVFTKKVFIAK